MVPSLLLIAWAGPVEDHRQAQIEALAQGDLQAYAALFDGDNPSSRGLLDAPWTRWFDLARRVESCTVGSVQTPSPTVRQFQEACGGRNDLVTLELRDGRWVQTSRVVQKPPVMQVNQARPSDLVAGPPLDGVELPPIRYDVTMSPPFVERDFSHTNLVSIGSSPQTCDQLGGALGFSGNKGPWRTQRLSAATDSAVLHFLDRDGRCILRLVQESSTALPTPFGCNTPACRLARGEIEPEIPYADPFTEADLQASQAAKEAALRNGDLEALLALFDGSTLWSQWHTATREMWQDAAALRRHCTTGGIRMRGPDEARVEETCPGSSLQLTFRRHGDRWLRREDGSYSMDPSLTSYQVGWTVPGPPLPGMEPPEVPVEMDLSAPFVYSAAKLGVVGTLPAGCGSLDALEVAFRVRMGDAQILPSLEHAGRTLEIEYQQVEGKCRALVTWAP
ncbi:MAG: hypothetical protein KC656_31170, partial [Myxococcales bacterium]|nr:hypothetical protein [Myxococcales bacterium]